MADGAILINTKINNSELPKQLKEIKDQIKSFSEKLRDTMQGVVPAIREVVDGFKSIAGATIGQAAKIEDMTAAFTPLTGNVQNAKNMINALNKEAATTPFELEDIGAVAKQLLPALGNNINAVTETFRMLGDTAGGNALKLDSITRGYTKTLLKGKVDMESLNMIADAGVPIYKELANSMGISVAQMVDMSSKGNITANDLTNAFKKMTSEGGIFFNGMQIASETLNGKMSTMSDNFKQAGAVIGDLLLPIVKNIVDTVNNIVGSFINWAKENDNLKKAIETVGMVLAGLTAATIAYFAVFQGGAIATGATAAITGIATAFKVLTAAMAANPIGVIAVAITAVLIPAVILLLKNWDKVVVIFQTTIAKLEEYFRIFGSMIEEVFTTGFNGAKIAALSFAQIILQKVLGSVQSLLEVMGKLPFVGDMFLDAAGSVQGFRNSLNEVINAVKEESQTAIREAKNKQDVIEKISKNNIDFINSESKARLEALEKQKEMNKEEEKLLNTSGNNIIENGTKPKEIKDTFDLVAATKEYETAIITVNDKLKDGYIDEKANKEEILNLIKQQIDLLYEQGFVADENSGIQGDRMLSALLDNYKKMQDESVRAGEKTGESFNEGVKKGLTNTLHKVSTSLKNVVKTAYQVIQKGISIFQNIFSGIQSFAKFDPAEMYASFKEIIDSLTNFFMKDLGSLPIFFKSGADLITQFLQGLTDNTPAILETLKNLIKTFIKGMKDNSSIWIKQVVKFVEEISKVILQNAPELIEAFLKVFLEITQEINKSMKTLTPYIVEALKGIIQAIFDILPDIIDTVTEASKIMTTIVIQLIPAFIKAIVSNLPKIIIGLIQCIVAVSTELIKEFPRLLVEVGKSLVQGIIEGFSKINLWDEICKFFVAFVEDIKNFFGIASPSTEFADIGNNVIQGFINGITNSDLWKSCESSFQDFQNKFNTWADGCKKDIDKWADGVKNSWESTTQSNKDKFDTWADNAKHTWDTNAEKVKKFFGFAGGTDSAPGGVALVGEEGPELVNLPRGSQVFTAEETKRILSGSGYNDILRGLQGGMSINPVLSGVGGQNITLYNNMTGNITVDGREIGKIAFRNIDRFAKGAYGI